jgi:NACHT domain
MAGENTRRSFHLLVGATLTVATSVVGSFLTSSLTGEQSWWLRMGWLAAGIAITFFYLRWQLRSQEVSPEAIKERVSQLEPELRVQVQSRSSRARRELIEAPLKKLNLDIESIETHIGWVRDHRLREPTSIRKETGNILAAFNSSQRRLLIVGEPGSGKSMVAYSLVETLDEREGKERVPLLINLSAWEAQDNFEAFLVDYLCSSVGYGVPQRKVASAFINSHRYTLILDGLDEIHAELRTHLSERLDKFIREGLPDEVGVVVTCRTQEYEEMLATYPEGLGLVGAVKVLSLNNQQLDEAFVELAKNQRFGDKDWTLFLSQRHVTAYQPVRHLLSSPLFLNLAVAGRLRARELLDRDNEQELRELVLDRYLDHTLADESRYEFADARRYLAWIARFLNGVERSPFDLRTPDSAVFDLSHLTPPEPPLQYRLFETLVYGFVLGLGYELVTTLLVGARAWNLGSALVIALICGLTCALMPTLLFASVGLRRLSTRMRFLLLALASLVLNLVFFLGFRFISPEVWFLLIPLMGGTAPLLVSKRFHKTSARHSRLTFVRSVTQQQRREVLRKAGRRVRVLLMYGVLVTLALGGLAVWDAGFREVPIVGLVGFLALALGIALAFGLSFVFVEARPMLIAFRTPKEASSRSLVTALIYGLITPLVFGLALALAGAVGSGLSFALGLERVPLGVSSGQLLEWLFGAMIVGLVFGFIPGIFMGLNNGGWFVLLQKAARRRLARAAKLPLRAGDFLEWGIERQIFRRVGGGVRFRHNLIQQHLANTSAGAR